MRILLDLYKLKTLNSGLGQFSKNFAETAMRLAPAEFQFNFLIPRGTNFDAQQNPVIRAHFIRRYFSQFNPDYDLWHSLQQYPSYFPNNRTKQLLTIHDLNFLVEKSSKKQEKYLELLKRNIDKATAINCISEYTASVLKSNINIDGKPMRIIYCGSKLQEFPEFEPNFPWLQKKYFFSVGIFNDKKNFEVLIPVMKYFDDHMLVLAGNHQTPYGDKVKGLIDKYQLQDRIVLTGQIREEEKYWLYAHTEALLFPSLAEGFGLPVIEAMSQGKPTFLSTQTSLPEIGGDLAYYFESFEEEAMAQLIKEKLNEFYKNKEELKIKLKSRAAFFSWDNCLNSYLDYYKEIISS
ncbi:MAG: glycosyltransferase family 4 protein [Saprospiraceae bacterium]|nr:glycosyltransferase family 4 protein [Candidatus Vicinibacter affinis]